jgi:hypothetical protein
MVFHYSAISLGEIYQSFTLGYRRREIKAKKLKAKRKEATHPLLI